MALLPAVQREERKDLAPTEFFEREFLASPFGLMRRFTREMDRMFGDFGVKPRIFDQPLTEFVWAPDLEVIERNGKLLVRADLPGLAKEDVKVNVVDDVLTIQGERKKEIETKKDDFYRTERTYGSFFRSLALPEGTKTDQVHATFKDGVLEVTMPLMAAEKKVKSVEVKVT
jgi:HSP20 family protein